VTYDVEGPDPVPRRDFSRPARTAIVLAVLAVAVLLAGRWGWEQLTQPFGDATADAAATATPGATASPTCTPAPEVVTLPEPGEITVRVYNASGVSGIAGRTADQLEQQGFVIETVANEPTGTRLNGVGELRSAPDSEARVEQLLRYLPGVAWVQDDRTDPTVDLAIGTDFGGVQDPSPLPPAPTDNVDDDIPTC
jgi:hypothetical protein